MANMGPLKLPYHPEAAIGRQGRGGSPPESMPQALRRADAEGDGAKRVNIYKVGATLKQHGLPATRRMDGHVRAFAG